MREQGRAYPRAEQHHVFPQALRRWFAARFGAGHDIDEYTVLLSWGEHNAIHTSARGGTAPGGGPEADLVGWNDAWDTWVAGHPDATEQAIFEQAGQMMDRYGISRAVIERYRTPPGT